MSTKNIEPKLKVISHYLELGTNETFAIPEYQRAYSWGILQCDKLWQDIESFIDSGAEDPYFFGTIIVDCSDDKNGKLNIIDGQQRTTTFLLLLKALQLRISYVLKHLAKSDETEALEEGLRDSYNKILKILYRATADERVEIKKDWEKAKGITILENHSINELYKKDITTIIEAKTFLEAENQVTTLKWKKKDNKYTNFFRNFKFFYNKLSEYQESQLNQFAKIFLDSCQIIEIKSWQIEQAISMFNSLNSTGMPLSDADIISAQLYANSATDKERFSETWARINRLASDMNSHKLINIDGVLQEAMYIFRSKNKEYGKGDVTTPGIRKYYMIEHPELLKEPIKLCGCFEKILQIWDKIKVYPFVKLMLKFNENSKLFLISYLNRYEPKEISQKTVEPIVECLIRLFAVNELVDAGYSSSKFKTFLFDENIHLTDPHYPIEQIKRDFDSHIIKSWDSNVLKENLLDYSKNTLVFLNEYLYAKSKESTFNFDDKVNIEHIMPSSGHNIGHIREDAGIATQEEFDVYANKLGNKILLEENINKSIGNNWFRTKKGHLVKDKEGYVGSSFCLALALSHYPKDLWQKEDIDTATEKATNRILSFILGES